MAPSILMKPTCAARAVWRISPAVKIATPCFIASALQGKLPKRARSANRFAVSGASRRLATVSATLWLGESADEKKLSEPQPRGLPGRRFVFLSLANLTRIQAENDRK